MKFGLQIKFTMLFLGFMFLITMAVLGITEYNNEIIIEQRFYDYAVSIGSLAASMVPAEEVLHFKEQMQIDQEYRDTMKELQRIQEQTNIHYLYVIAPVSDTQGIYIYDVETEESASGISQEQTFALGEPVDLSRGFDIARKAMETGKVGNQFEYEGGVDMEDTLASAFVPILDGKGKAVAFVGVDMDIGTIWDSITQARNQVVVTMVILMAGCYVILMMIVRLSIIRPIRRLKFHAQQLSAGHFSEKLPVRGHDEISDITGVFNRMSRSIQGHMEEVKGINDAYHKYVPSELLEILEKENITEVELGNRAIRPVTVFYFRLMGNRKDMMTQNGGQMMEDMNVLFQTTIPVIMEHHGYIQSFQGTGMTAVYTDGVKGAVLSAVSICENLIRAGNFGQDASSGISMGITYGNVLFGIVGHEKRMAAVSISAEASMAAYLQKLAFLYGAKLFITASAAEQIPDFQTAYHYRFIGMIENKYSKVVEKIYDIYDGDCEEQRSGKERTKDSFERGVELFCMRRFKESRQAFIQTLKLFRKDKAAKRYLKYCNQYYQKKDTDTVSVFLGDG